VNLHSGRNLAGTFHPARDVLADVDLLASLPHEEYISGLAEMLKIGIIGDPALFDAASAAGGSGSSGVNATHIARSIGLKSAVVREDPHETGRRKVLNLGHTLGHALESASGYTMRHGEAVAIGIAAIARLSAERGWASQEEARRIVAGLERVGLPTTAEAPLLERCAPAMGRDKKSDGARVDLIRIHKVGEVSVIGISLDEVGADLVRSGGVR
jgi:3-dehydroquinate synthetase